MLVAGDHTVNDIAGEEDSWASVFKEHGIPSYTVVSGLGAMKPIQAIYIRHLREVIENAV
jgi:sirohydrochlorin cobaltochelatase